MDRFAHILASLVRRQPVLLVTATMLAALALSFGIPRLKFETGQDSLLDPSTKVMRDNTRYQQEFGGDYLIVLFETPLCSGGQPGCERPRITQLFTARNREELARLGADLEATGDYHSIISPLDILQFAQVQIQTRMVTQPQTLAADEQTAMDEARAASAARDESPEQQEAAAQAAKQAVDDAFNADFGPDAKRFLAVGEQSLDNPAFVEFIMYGADGKLRPEFAGIFPDDYSALMVIRPRGNLSIDEGARVSAYVPETVAGYSFDGVTPLASGPPLLIKEINDGMKTAMTRMAILAVIIMGVVLFTVFRARWRLLSLPAVLVGCVAAFGLMGFVGIPLTMVTISGLPILIGLGVDFAIQVHSRIEEETFASGSAEAGLERTFRALGPALAIAALAACIGFMVLWLSEVPMIRDFGSMLAVGAIIVFVTSIALISGVVFLRERTRLGPQLQPRVRFEVERLVGGITARTMGRLLPIAAVAAVIALGGLWLSRDIPTQTDPERMVPSNSKVLNDLHHVRDVAGSTSELNLLVETTGGRKITDQDVLDWMLAFEQRQMQQRTALRTSNSIASFTEQVTGTRPTTASAESALASAPRSLVVSVVNDERTMASITFAIGDTSLSSQQALNDAIIADARPPDGITVAPAGIAVVGSATVDALSSNRDLMSFVAIAAILALLLVLFRSPVKAIAPMLPVVLALGASAMAFYISGTSYSPLTSISGPLIIAMGTEFNILLMSRYFEERAAGLSARAAMSTASLRIGRAIAASGLTVMGGFAVLAFSNFPLLDNFGRVTAINIGLCLISTLILLPPLLVWADEERHLPAAATTVPG
ncbi:MAG: MMPL family transporter [Chloroflexi bacterium]|nr:MMPL family transporter [Chloroflexota bacterium]